ncbi:MAG: hypothetical protein AAFA34_01355 [Thermoplasmata archaeon]
MGMTSGKPLTPSGGTAKTLILVGLIFQAIFALIFFFGVGLLSLAVALAAANGAGAGAVLLAGLFVGLGLIGFILLFLAYSMSYRRTRNGEYQAARTPTLVFAILSFLTINIIAGILYIIGYVKLGDAAREQAQQTAGAGTSYNPNAASPPVAPAPGPAASPGAAPSPSVAPNCPKCGQPTTWVAQYQRYYCYSCSQYV